MPPAKQLFFDLDGTLLLTRGAGVRAMHRSGRELFGNAFEALNVSGGLDPLIYDEAARRCGVDEPDQHHNRFRDQYLEYLEQELVASAADVTVLPGVIATLDLLAQKDDVGVGLVTGNYKRAAPIKLSAAGIEHGRFNVSAFGDEAPDRPAMVALALQRVAIAYGTPISPTNAIVIGDTPKDVNCAHANGCPCLAVATGLFSSEQLRNAGADVVVEDLLDPTPLLELIAR